MTRLYIGASIASFGGGKKISPCSGQAITCLNWKKKKNAVLLGSSSSLSLSDRTVAALSNVLPLPLVVIVCI